MKIERTKRSVNSSLSGLIFKFISLLLPFIIRTVIIKKLGEEYVGLSTLFTSVLQVLSLSELGFASAIAYAMYKPIAEDDKPKLCALLNFIKNIYRIIGALILVLGVAVMPFLHDFINSESVIPSDINLYILYSIYLFNTVISYWLFAYKSVILAANQRLDVENIILSVCNLVMFALQVGFLYVFPNYYVFVIFLPLSTVAINICRSVMVRKIYPDIVCKGTITADEKRSVYQNIGALIGHRLSGAVVTSIMNIIISANLGLILLTRYGNYYVIINALIGFITIMYNSVTAGIGNSIVVDSVEKNYGDFKNITFVNVWIVGWIAICFACLAQPFMKIWMGEDKMLPFDTVLLFTLYFYLWKFKDIVSTYKDAAGMWKADMIKPYVVTAVSLILGLVLIKPWGINGTLVAVIVGVFAVSMPWETHVFFKNYFHLSPKAYYFKLAVYSVIVALVAVLTYFLCGFVPDGGILNLALKGIICLIVPNAAFLLFGFKTSEFKWVVSKFRQIFSKR